MTARAKWPESPRALVAAIAFAMASSGDRERLRVAIDVADHGEAAKAIAEFVALRAGTPEVAAAAAFDEARVRFTRAGARPLPPPPPEVGVDAALLADVRGRLLALRNDLEAARALLLGLRGKRGSERDVAIALAHVTDMLAEVNARDRDWKASVEAGDAWRSASGAAARGPLKAGPSGSKSSAGAPGKKTGASDGSKSEGSTPAGEGVAGGSGAALGPEALAALAATLESVLRDARSFDQKRASEALLAAPSRRN